MLMLVEVVVVGGGGSGGGSGGGMVMEFAYMTYMSRRRHTTTVNSSQLSINRRAVCLLYTISPEHSQLSCRRFVASSVIVRLFARCAKIKKRKGYFPPPLSTSRPHYHHYHHPPPLPLPLQIITTTPPPNAGLRIAGNCSLYRLPKSSSYCTPYTLSTRPSKMLRQIHKSLHELCQRGPAVS